MNYWLMKSEPSTFSIDHLAAAKKSTSGWDGVRNFQARNFLREMKNGDLAFFYHSSCDVPGVAGIVKVVREGYPDPTAFDAKDDHYDPDSKRDNPRWYCVDVKLEKKFDEVVTLEELRKHEKGKLKNMIVLKRGNRLSVTPVTKSEFEFIASLATSI
ncbi:putative RNA-binding protein with PUA-like domain [Povalibacter uvarum]|uniref:Putative RNA-binding protein with PUA-like domain n=1 Tax=Povalibacter uvarum TaxID=732238 RepID=A0A841HMJ3_9GAMM|nr:EVE domain-containing protein [Povalibacter uvarum]MBB6094327.1 putative RNA-binding protein with PUA-like domain [Povalibacter uvarum]